MQAATEAPKMRWCDSGGAAQPNKLRIKNIYVGTYSSAAECGHAADDYIVRTGDGFWMYSSSFRLNGKPKLTSSNQPVFKKVAH
jgi:hypothetical protein